MPDPIWSFRHLPEDQKQSEPTHSQEFDRNGADRSLVREAIQNSLDARLDHSRPVRVRMRIGIATGAQCFSYLEGLWPHLAKVQGFLKTPKPGSSFRYLVIEDFNTKGLTGDVNGMSEGAGRDRNHFYCFWHKIGQSTNQHKTLGNRGVGKVAFQVASGIKTFFGVTRRYDDPDKVYLMGEAGLVTHEDPSHPGRRCDWYGYFATREGRSLRACPSTNSHYISRFADVFGLASARSTPGLSVVVPYVDVKAENLLHHAIDSYLVNFVEGHLELEVIEQGGDEWLVNQNSLEKVCAHSFGKSQLQAEFVELGALAKLVRASRGHQAGAAVLRVDAHLKAGEGYRLRAADEVALSEARRRYEQGRSFAVDIALDVRKATTEEEEGAGEIASAREVLTVIGEEAEGLKKPNWHHLRCGLHVSKLRSRGPAGTRGIVLAGSLTRPGLLAQLLQKSEEPAHELWHLQGTEYRNAVASFDDARHVITLCRDAAFLVGELLRPSGAVINRRALAAYLPVIAETGKMRPDKPGGKKPQGPLNAESPPPGVVSCVVLRWPGGDRDRVPEADVRLEAVDVSGGTKEVGVVRSGEDGLAVFRETTSGSYVVSAEHPVLGAARHAFELPEKEGVAIRLLLKKSAEPAVFTLSQTAGGFVVTLHPSFTGPFRRARIKMAYEGFGGDIRFRKGDFDLLGKHIEIKVEGAQEKAAVEMVTHDNIIECTPVNREFRLEVTGFNRRFALSVDVRALRLSSEDINLEEESA